MYFTVYSTIVKFQVQINHMLKDKKEKKLRYKKVKIISEFSLFVSLNIC
jgi:hypothetical protein